MPVTVPMNDLRAQWAEVREDVLAAVERVGASGWLVLGREVERFEGELARRWGLPQCVGCGSGLDAIEIALRSLGLPPGEAVLTTPLSAFATTLGIVRAGGVPHFVDVDESGQLDLDLVEPALASGIRFVLPVHLYGHAGDVPRLAEFGRRFGATVMEDCAQAIGARNNGMVVGAASAACATSFYPTKNLGAMGEGGAVLASTERLAEAARSLRDYGRKGRDAHELLGLNSRLDELHAAILRDAQLPRLDAHLTRRREVAAAYGRGLRHPALTLPPAPAGSESSWHLFPVLVSTDREAFRSHLRGRGVETGVHYPVLIPDQPALLDVPGAKVLTPLRRAAEFAAREVSLPVHPYLTDGDVEKIIDACNAWQS
ncbi:MAG: DegT/DnrJ/EryC1/StrS family aminotransferase [Myxococcota bacterium]